MKKRSILNLIKAYSEKNDILFRNEAYSIANDFEKTGDLQLSEYIYNLLSDGNLNFVPQNVDSNFSFLKRANSKTSQLFFPSAITKDLYGIVNAVKKNFSVNKFLFIGKPGTGKTEAAKLLADILARELYEVNFNLIIDSKLGQTPRNIARLFEEINSFAAPNKALVLFDELDALVLDRNNGNDVREMGRATSSFLREFDKLNSSIIIIATTNMSKFLDKAVVRRFDYVIDFDKYSRENIFEIANFTLANILNKYPYLDRDIRLFNRIINCYDSMPTPAVLNNMIKTSVAFSSPNDGSDYFKRLYFAINGTDKFDLAKMRKQQFSIREMEKLTGISRSTLARNFKG